MRAFDQALRKHGITHVVGHSILGDLKLLHLQARRCSVHLPKLRGIDTFDMCRATSDGAQKCSLVSCYMRQVPDTSTTKDANASGAHNAAADAKMTWELFNVHRARADDYVSIVVEPPAESPAPGHT